MIGPADNAETEQISRTFEERALFGGMYCNWLYGIVEKSISDFVSSGLRLRKNKEEFYERQENTLRKDIHMLPFRN